MKINEEKLTAYALNELPEGQRLAVEKELETNPEARKAVDEIKKLSEQLKEHYTEEEKLLLTDEQRETIFAAAREKKTKVIPFLPRYVWMPLTSVAAVAVIILAVGLPRFYAPHEVLHKEEPRFEGRKIERPKMEPEKADSKGVKDEISAVEIEAKFVPVPEAIVTEDFRHRPKMELRRPMMKVKKASADKSSLSIGDRNNRQTATIDMPQSDEWKGDLTGGTQGFEMMPKPSQLSLYGSVRSRSLAKREEPASAPQRIVSVSELAKRERGGLSARQLKRFVKNEGASTQWGPSIEDYDEIRENEFKRVSDEPLSTFSIDVDTASYANVRRFLKSGTLPPKDAVRIEEMINYFDYAYEAPADETPFAANFAQAQCPWNQKHKLVRIGLKGREIAKDVRPPLNLTFLLDVSGSMNNQNKLPLVKRAMTMLVNQLDERDRVSIVVYAGASGLVLPPTSGANGKAILEALDRLKAGGGTNGGQGIQLAYKTALENFSEEGVNRVMLCTDGDFNIGVTQGGDLNRLIEEKAKSGIFLSVLGFGTGNYKDSAMEQLADRGNGNYAYIDTFSEARKVLVDQMSGTLVTIAKDVKIQVEFNPVRVAGYRLIGYENRMLATEDFNDDTKDAGEIGAGHTVTALYEIIPAGHTVNGVPPVDELKYQVAGKLPVQSKELLSVKLRYKQPDGDTSRKLEFPLADEDRSFEQAGDDFRFATSVAGFGMLLRDSEFADGLTHQQVLEWATHSQGEDEFGYRREFTDLIRNAAALDQ